MRKIIKLILISVLCLVSAGGISTHTNMDFGTLMLGTFIGIIISSAFYGSD